MIQRHLLAAFCFAIPAAAQFTEVTSVAGLLLPPSGFSIEQGAAWADFDGNGWVDLFASGGTNRPITLWLNQCDGTFASQVIAPAEAGRYDSAVVAADFDNDGDQDVFIAENFGNPCRLYVNDGAANFTDEAAARGVAFAGNGMAVSFGDYDRDGYLDLFLSEYNAPSLHHLFRNDGDGTFTEVTGSVATGAVPALTYAAAFIDYDQDLWPDILSTPMNDGPTQVLRSQPGEAGFVDVGPAVNADYQIYGMGITAGDIHNDGDMDVFMTNITNHMFLEWDRQTGAYRDLGSPGGVAATYGVTGGFAWGCEFLDYDNDGLLDLTYAASDSYCRLMRGTPGQAPFLDVTFAMGLETVLRPSYTLSTLDYDNDGNLDIFAAGGTYGGHLARNPGFGGHWLRVRLEGTTSNRDGIGSIVIAHTSSASRRRFATTGESFLSQSDKRLHFGLGTDSVVEQLEVRWPSGTLQVLPNVAVDTEIHVTEPRLQISGPLSPGSANTFQTSLPDDAGQFFVAGLTTSIFPEFRLSDGRILRIDLTNHVLGLTTNPGNPYFGPSLGVVPPSGDIALNFDVPNLPGVSGTEVHAFVFTVDASFPDSIRSLVGPQPFVLN